MYQRIWEAGKAPFPHLLLHFLNCNLIWECIRLSLHIVIMIYKRLIVFIRIPVTSYGGRVQVYWLDE